MPEDERDMQEKRAAGAPETDRAAAARAERPPTDRPATGAGGERREEAIEGDLSSADWGE